MLSITTNNVESVYTIAESNIGRMGYTTATSYLASDVSPSAAVKKSTSKSVRYSAGDFYKPPKENKPASFHKA
jgi:hypothetical protein